MGRIRGFFRRQPLLVERHEPLRLALGVEDAAIDIGFSADHQLIRSWRSGRVIMRQDRAVGTVERFGAKFLTIHRADLLETLAAPVLLLPSVQVNIRAGNLPPAAPNGTVYLRIPVKIT